MLVKRPPSIFWGWANFRPSLLIKRGMHYTPKKIITTLGWGGNMTTRFHPPQIPHNSLVHKSRTFIIYLNIILLKSSPISQSISAFVSFMVHMMIRYHRPRPLQHGIIVLIIAPAIIWVRPRHKVYPFNEIC